MPITAIRGLIIIHIMLIVSVFLLAATPPVSKDALTQHLAVPKLFLLNSGIYEIPELIASYNPLNIDLLYAIPLYFGNDIIPKYIHFAFALATAFIIFVYLKKRLSTVYGLLGSLFFLSIPIIIKLSITAYVDLGLIFFSSLAILSLFYWIDNPNSNRFFWVAAVSCGLGLGIKYNGLLTVLLLTILIPYIYVIKNNDDSIKSIFKGVGFTVIFVAVACVLFSPWLVRNYTYTNNPLYPLFDTFFNPHNPIEVVQLSPFFLRYHVFHEAWWEILLIPIRVFFTGQDGLPQQFDGKLNPLLLILPMFLFLVERKNQQKKENFMLFIFSIGYLFLAFLKADMRIRYIGPIIPPLVILSIQGFHSIVAYASILQKKRLRPLILLLGWSILGGGFIINICYFVYQFQHVSPFPYILGKQTRCEYIQKFRPEYATIEYANKNLGLESKIFCIFLGNRQYYSDSTLIFGNQIFERLLNECDSADGIYDYMKKEAFTHLIVNHAMFQVWAEHVLTKEENEKAVLFLKIFTTKIFEKDACALYSIK